MGKRGNYQPITNFGSVGLKVLNDQLYDLWNNIRNIDAGDLREACITPEKLNNDVARGSTYKMYNQDTDFTIEASSGTKEMPMSVDTDDAGTFFAKVFLSGYSTTGNGVLRARILKNNIVKSTFYADVDLGNNSMMFEYPMPNCGAGTTDFELELWLDYGRIYISKSNFAFWIVSTANIEN